MAYLGKYETRTADFKVYTSSTATATHTLSWTPTSKQSLRITINGVVQQDDAFSLTGNTVTLDAAILVTDVLEIVGVNELGGQVLVPADGSIQTGKLGDNSVTLAKMAGGTDGNLITYDTSGDPAYVATGTATHVLTSNGAGAAPTFQAPAAGGKFASYAILADQKTSGTGGGTFTSGSWQTRDLQTKIYDGITPAITFSTNEFTLGAGDYLIKWYAPAWRVSGHQSRLYDVTGAAEVEVGSTAYTPAPVIHAGGNVLDWSLGAARVSPSSSNAYRIEHQCQVTFATEGFGPYLSFGTEQFTVVEVFKES